MTNAAEIEEERTHFANVVTTFKKYSQYSLAGNFRRRKDYYSLPLADQELLNHLGYKQKLADVDKAIKANAEFINQIIENPDIFGPHLYVDHTMEDDQVTPDSRIEALKAGDGSVQPISSLSHTHSHSNLHSHEAHSHAGNKTSRKHYEPTEFDMDKLRSTLKQFVRDWSEEGKEEREGCYKPIKDALLAHFSDVPYGKRRNLRVLVPGAGLGRLAFDVANLGFTCQGNEFSHYMLLASYFVLNRTDQVHKYTIYPYIHSFSNALNHASILRPITIPDVLPSSLPVGSDFSLVAGDFEEIYGKDSSDDEPHSGLWDAVLTCYFIDTATNIVNYLRIIHRILAPGGVWINLGPLLWHFESNRTGDTSIDLSLDEVKQLARAIGFKISNERTIETTYAGNSQTMLTYIYRAAFWTATKES